MNKKALIKTRELIASGEVVFTCNALELAHRKIISRTQLHIGTTHEDLYKELTDEIHLIIKNLGGKNNGIFSTFDMAMPEKDNIELKQFRLDLLDTYINKL